MAEKQRRSRVQVLGIVVAGILAVLAGVYVWRQATAPDVTENPGRTDTVVAQVVRVIGSDAGNGTQQLELQFVSGPLRGERRQVEYQTTALGADQVLFGEGDDVMVAVTPGPTGGTDLFVSDYARTGAITLLGLLFVTLTIVVSKAKGLRWLIGLSVSMMVLIGFVLPSILAGQDPVLASIFGSFAVLTITLYLTQVWSLKTHAAILGLLLSLALIGVLSTFAVEFTRLTGTGTEEAVSLHASRAIIGLRGLFLAGLIIGTLGFLNDMVVSQASAVMELANANPALTWRDLYGRAMNIGQDHIAATINTLALAYVGVAMPSLLLFQINPQPWYIALNREFVGEEIVRTLVGALGLIAAMPITTLIASLLRRYSAAA